MKLLFATDLHGSDAVFAKCMRLIMNDTADVLLLGGDLSGKAIVPIVENGKKWMIPQQNDRSLLLSSKEELDTYEEMIGRTGRYTYKCDKTSFERLRSDEAFSERILRDLRQQRLSKWIVEAREKVGLDHVFFGFGNDDPFYMDDVVRRETGCEPLEQREISLDSGFQIVSCGYTNVAPWHCPRDVPEDDLLGLLRSKFEARNRMDLVIANIHCPPFGTLDRAPLLDSTLRPVVGADGVEMESVGSTAVRLCIEHYQPPLALHGHIHEAFGKEYVGSTLCVNPGSVYFTGELRAALVHLDHGRVKGVQLVREG